METIVLSDLSDDVQKMIEQRALKENITHTKAVIEFLQDACTAQAIEHDIALMEESWKQGEEQMRRVRPACHCHHHSCCCCHHACG